MHSVADPSRVRFNRPLGVFAPGLAQELAELGYTRMSATNQLQLAAHLSRWLAAVGIGVDGLTESVMDRFLAQRRASHTNYHSLRALGPIMGYLGRVGAAPAAASPTPPVSAVDVPLERFGRYLRGQPALTAPVVRAYPWRPAAELLPIARVYRQRVQVAGRCPYQEELADTLGGEQDTASSERFDGVFQGLMDLSQVTLLDDALYYLCGPIPFMRPIRRSLIERGVAWLQQSAESFVGAGAGCSRTAFRERILFPGPRG